MSNTKFIPIGTNARDLRGQRFGRLLVIKPAIHSLTKKGVARIGWVCACDCGTTRVFRGDFIARHSLSCGCRSRELALARATRHGMTNTSTWHSWHGMKNRCLNPKARGYPAYGAVGITVCKAWQMFDTFFADMGDKPTLKHSIDRWPNKHGGYWCGKCAECSINEWPLNVRWATPKEQARNKRNTMMLTFKDQTKSLAEWSEITGVPLQRIRVRFKEGYPPEAVLNPERNPLNRHYGGATK